MTIWQLSAGDGKRRYEDVLVRYGLAAIGPGEYGRYTADALSPYHARWKVVRIFSDLVKPEDLVVLKRPSGTDWEAVAVGRVAGEYNYADHFEDVEGFDVRHVRAVEWRRPELPIKLPGLRRGTLARVKNVKTQVRIRQVYESASRTRATELPPLPPIIEPTSLVDALIRQGLTVRGAEEVVASIQRVRRLAQFYALHGSELSEHEMRTFLVIPLLLALGWSEQQIKIEWSPPGSKHRLDVVLFDRPYEHGVAEPVAVIETKAYGDALIAAKDQVRGYAAQLDGIRHLFVTDGVRYKMLTRTHVKDPAKWSESGYLNLRTIRLAHPLKPALSTAAHVLSELLPNRKRSE